MATSIFAGDSRGTARPGAMAEMNITPLVDVMLVLLIIFMVAAPMATRSIDLRLPGARPPQPQPVPSAHVSLLVQGDGVFALDGVQLGEHALASALAAVARQAPATIVDVKVNDEADYQAFTTAIATARRSGLSNVALQQE